MSRLERGKIRPASRPMTSPFNIIDGLAKLRVATSLSSSAALLAPLQEFAEQGIAIRLAAWRICTGAI